MSSLCRVSTDKQADWELSIPAQLQAMRRYAQERDWIILEEFIEAGASGRTADRPTLRQLLHRCRNTETTQVDVVLIHKIDRLARNVADHIAIRAQLRQSNVSLASVTESLEDSVPGQLVEHILASMAEFYSANLSEEVKKGMQQKVLQGGWPHMPPVGYCLVPSASGVGRSIEVDPVLGPAVRKAFEGARRGFVTWHQFRHALALEGLKTTAGKTLPVSSLSRLLGNPFYIGQLRWKGTLQKGNHPPLIDRAVFEQVQHVLKTRSPRRPHQKHHFLMRGIARCAACHELMTAERHEGFVYYRCRAYSRASNRCTARFCNGRRALAGLERIYRQILLTLGTRRGLLSRIQTAMVRTVDRPLQRIDAPHFTSTRAEIDFRNARTLWDVHCRLPVPAQTALLETVFESLELSASGIERFVLNLPYRELSKLSQPAA